MLWKGKSFFLYLFLIKLHQAKAALGKRVHLQAEAWFSIQLGDGVRK